MHSLFQIGSNSLGAQVVRGLAIASLGAGILGAAGACGAPGELDQDLFPATYTDNTTAVGAAGSPTVRPANAGGTAGMAMGTAGTAVMPPVGAAGMMEMMEMMEIIADPSVPGCDAPSLFKRSVEVGGCTSGGGDGCHEGGPNTVSPDLVSNGVAARLMAATSTADSCAGLTIVGDSLETSYLIDKIEEDGSPQCGFQMPFLSAGNLSDVDRQCIIDWVTAISGGG